jgi:AraC-like DNA-binding protein
MDNATYEVSMASYNPFDCDIPAHSHSKNSFEIHYIPTGYGFALIEGKNYDISPNTLFVTGPHIEHAQTPHTDDPMKEYCVYMKVHPNQRKLQKNSITSALYEHPFWFGQDMQNIYLFLQLIFYELETPSIGSQQKLTSLFELLVIQLVRNYDNSSLTKVAAHTPRLINIPFLVIEEAFLNGYKDLTLQNLAERIGLSTRQTERLLKQYYNSSFQKKKTEARMAAATSLLRNTSTSITDIAEQTGYSSSEHFAHAFKSYYQMSASDYRKKKIGY